MSVRIRTILAGMAVAAVVVIAAAWIVWTHTGTSERQGEAATLSGGDTGVLAVAVLRPYHRR